MGRAARAEHVGPVFGRPTPSPAQRRFPHARQGATRGSRADAGVRPTSRGKRFFQASGARLLSRALLLLLASLSAFAQAGPGEWQSLFDGKTLRGWRETPFTGRGKVHVGNGTITLGTGAPMTGITWTGEFPRSDYELRFEGARMEGDDFFASVTFPVGDSFMTWVTGGWGGDIVGLSSIDGWDASENETRCYFNFEEGRWYALRLRVSAGRITAWIDDRQIINVDIGGRSVGLRYGEIKLSAPFGFASYATTGALRKIEYRILPERERK